VPGRLVSDTPPLAVAAGRTGASFLVISAISALQPRSWFAIRASAGRRRAVISLAFLGFFAYYTGTLLGVRSRVPRRQRGQSPGLCVRSSAHGGPRCRSRR
jgi:hypothetical protein